MADDGTRNFPNAQIYMAQADFDFWTDERKRPERHAQDRSSRAPASSCCRTATASSSCKDGQEFLPGIQAMAAPGHTVGHTVYMITSQGKSSATPATSPIISSISVETPRLRLRLRHRWQAGGGSRAARVRHAGVHQDAIDQPTIFPGRGSATSPGRATVFATWPRRCAWCRRGCVGIAFDDAARRSCRSSSTPKPISISRSRGSSPPIRGSATFWRAPDGRRCGGGRTALPGWPRSWSRNNFRPPAPRRSGDGLPRRSIRSITRRCCARGRRGSRAPGCRRPRSAR